MGGEIPGDTLICCVYTHRAHVRASVGSTNETLTAYRFGQIEIDKRESVFS